MRNQERTREQSSTESTRQATTELPPDFSDWFHDHQPTVYRYVRFRVATRESAEDVTSEVFMKALESHGMQ